MTNKQQKREDKAADRARSGTDEKIEEFVEAIANIFRLFLTEEKESLKRNALTAAKSLVVAGLEQSKKSSPALLKDLLDNVETQIKALDGEKPR